MILGEKQFPSLIDLRRRGRKFLREGVMGLTDEGVSAAVQTTREKEPRAVEGLGEGTVEDHEADGLEGDVLGEAAGGCRVREGEEHWGGDGESAVGAGEGEGGAGEGGTVAVEGGDVGAEAVLVVDVVGDGEVWAEVEGEVVGGFRELGGGGGGGGGREGECGAEGEGAGVAGVGEGGADGDVDEDVGVLVAAGVEAEFDGGPAPLEEGVEGSWDGRVRLADFARYALDVSDGETQARADDDVAVRDDALAAVVVGALDVDAAGMFVPLGEVELSEIEEGVGFFVAVEVAGVFAPVEERGKGARVVEHQAVEAAAPARVVVG